MKKLLIFLMGILLLAQQGYSQKVTVVENFDNQGDIFVRTPSTAWKANNVYSKSSPYSCWGEVPKTFGDSITLVSPVYNLAVPIHYTFAYLRFSHICKLSPSDTARIEWRENMGGGIFSVWKPIPGYCYTGQAANYAQRGFCGASYTEWQGADSTATPDKLWWKEETFDISNLVGISEVQFRFIIKRGRVSGSNIAYGWLIDNFEFVYSTYNIKPPVVEFIAPLVRDTAYSTGPWEINAKVKSSTSVGLHQPYLKWTTDGITYDSAALVKTKGDSLWKATIPQYVVGTNVSYSITGRDSSGNTATANSSYFIAAAPPGQVGYVTIGTGTGTITTNPYYYNYNYSYSRNYYKSHEINPYRLGGVISEIAFYNTTANSSVGKITFYLKATTDTVNASYTYIDPLLDGAVKVWGEATATGGTGWITFQLISPFNLPPNMHLLVYCDNKNGIYQSQSSASFQYTAQTTNTSVYVYEDYSFPPTMYPSINGNRPNIRLNFIGGGTPHNNSASTHSIDINDTMPTSPSVQVPIVVTVKNKGTQNLNQITVSYTINGGAVQSKIFNFSKALTTDFNGQDTAGYYTPKMNGYDTLKVWVSLPNGVVDSTTWDDTLTKRIYGTTDLSAFFVNPPADTVYSVGPFGIKAKISSLSGNTVINTVRLYVESDSLGTTRYDTLSMAWNGTSNLWETTIAQKSFGSSVKYKISVNDYLLNTITISKSFYVKLLTVLSTDTSGYVIVGTNTLASDYNPFYFYTQYSWTRQLYLANEIRPSLNGGLITHIAWDYPYGLPLVKNNQFCYLKAVDDTACVSGYVDPIADGATMVWQGNFSSPSGRLWAEIVLSTPYMLPPNKNLMVYWIDNAGAPIPNGYSPYWYCTTTQNNMAIYATGNGNLPTQSTGTLTTERPNARFFVERVGATDSNSIALVSIDSPPKTVTSGITMPVTITVKNTGFKNLASCNVYWKKNGVSQSTTFGNTYTFGTPLQPGHTRTFNIANFTTSAKDSIVVWVSLPNGQLDPVKKDDTLSRVSIACPMGVLGVSKKTYTVGSSSSDFTTIGNAISYLENCGFSGKVTLQLENKTFRESADFSKVRATAKDTLEIVPLSGSPLIETTKYGIKLGGLDNVFIKNLRIKIDSGYGVWVVSGSNIEISGCTINLDTTFPARGLARNEHSGFYKEGGVSHNVRILNNTFVGGHTPVSAYGLNGTNRDTGWFFDGNTIRGGYGYNAYLLYVDFQSVSRNTCLMMNSPAVPNGYNSDVWAGFCIQEGMLKIMEENKIYGFIPEKVPRGIIFYNINSDTFPAELRNNEIILSKEGANWVLAGSYDPATGIQARFSSINFHHNSIYIAMDTADLTGSAAVDMYPAYAYNTCSVKNNNLFSENGYVISVYDNTTNPVILDYNNYYTRGTMLGYFRNTTAADFSAWKTLSKQDSNSMNKLADYVNPAINLKLANFSRKMSCTPPIAGITRDIVPSQRTPYLVTKGCYETLPVKSLNATLLEVLGLREGGVGGQTDTVKAVVLNTGTNPMTFVHITWTLNGTIRTSQNYTAVINPGQSITIPVGTITYPATNATVKIWIDYVNSGVVDGFQGDDTITNPLQICPNGYSGVLTIGPSSSSNFKTIEDAYKAIDVCGITGDITFAFESGTYNYGLNFTNNSARFGNYKLTITSITKNRNNVSFHNPSGATVILNNTRNFAIEEVTLYGRKIGGTTGTHAVQITGTCTNIVIRNCNLIVDSTITGYTYTPLYKGSSTGIVDSFRMVGCLLDGGYYGGAYFYGAGSGFGQFNINIVWDSNTFRNGYNYGLYPTYTDFKSFSQNKILSRTTNATSSWNGMYLYYCNADKIVGNSVIQRNTSTIIYPYGASLYYVNQYSVTSTTPTLFANNEFMLYTTSSYYGIYHYQSAGLKPIHYLHNSIYIDGTGASHGMDFSMSSGAFCVVKNNSIHTAGTSSYPIYLNTAFSTTYYDIDYNNMYAPTYVGYASGARTLISGANSWQTYVTSDRNSVKVKPIYINVANSLELSGASSNDSLRCPPLMATDIKGTARPAIGTMGAYEKPLSGLDLMLIRIQPTMNGVIHNQMLKLSVDIVNFGATAITSATLRWSINNILQPAAIPLTFNPSLKSYEQRNIFLDSFRVQGNYNIRVWIESVNGSTTADTVKWNDTVSHSYVVVPLAEFVAPFVADTINQLAFNVLVNIYEGTGAPVVKPPKMAIQTIYNGTTLYDTITMTRSGANWVAAIPPQYFNSKVIYSLFVADTMGNNILLRDSTFIKYDLGSLDFNLKMTSLVSPIIDPDAPCALAQPPVEVRITNTGSYAYNFAKDSMVLTCEMIDAQHAYSVFTKTINTGTLLSGQSSVYQIYPNVQMNLGTTDIKVWLSCRPERNNTTTDDTLTNTYTLTKLGFPVQEDFENPALPPEFTSVNVNTSAKWEVIQGNDGKVSPYSGSGMLRFGGSKGAVSQVYVKQLDLSMAQQPTLSFWYFHDTVACNDFTVVKVTTDGNVNAGDELQTIYKQDVSYGWKLYEIGLAKYTNSSCVVIVFEAMSYTSTQYIDLFALSATQNLKLDAILIPTLALCDYSNKNIQVVISNPSAQHIDFSKDSTRINLQVNAQNFTYKLNSGILYAQTSQTITITTMTFVSGTTYNLTATVLDPIDAQPSDDITKLTLVLDADIVIKAHKNTSAESCFRTNMTPKQLVTVQNKSTTYDLYNIPLTLSVEDGSGNSIDLINETLDSLKAGQSSPYEFKQSYKIPMTEDYVVTVRADLICDANQSTNIDNIFECVDFDIDLVKIIEPDNVYDEVGEPLYIVVRVANSSPYEKVNFRAQIIDGKDDKTIISSQTETIYLQANMVDEYRFSKPYNAPAAKNYTIKVFIDKMDKFVKNDTVTKKSTTDVGITPYNAAGFYLGQNIPNPAKENTLIAYNIPQDGEVIFTIYAITGQILYVEKRDAHSGNNEIAFSTANLANGIYYYAMEYKGERLVKKMTIRK